MSATVKSVVIRLDGLLAALQKLFASKSLETIVSLVARLGLDKVVTRGVELLQSTLRNSLSWLDGLRANLAQSDALSGLIGVLSPMLRGLGALSSAAGAGLSKAGLNALESVVEPAEVFSALGHQVLRSANQVLTELPSASQIDGLKTRITGILGSVDDLKS
ncbi:MAG: hypothetical protein ACPG4T_22585, partial [Nannocystaceae bacterium]